MAVKTTMSNPMMRAAASADDDGSAALKKSEEQYRIDMRMLGEEPPKDTEAWREFKLRFEEQAKQLQQLNETIAGLRKDAAVASTDTSATSKRTAATFMKSSTKKGIARRGSFKAVAAGSSRKANPLKKGGK